MPSRRHFIQTTAFGASSLAVTSALAQQNKKLPSNRIRVGVMGLSRGQAHIKQYLAIPGAEVAYVCDVDSRRLESAAKRVSEAQGKAVKAVTDFRRILDDDSVDALSIAAPNYWHAPATILACQAGKHVYVEKPGSHNPYEAVRMVQVAKETGRVVQMGNQRRSLPSFIEGIGKLRSGELGKLTAARCWYDNARGSIGRGKVVPTPDWLDYDLWQGPVPAKPYKDNLVHYNWHWLWHWGNGELGNNGVHALDIARWGLGVDLPLKTSYIGGRYHFDDDQETPDTGDATFDYGHCYAAWHGSSCHRRKAEKHAFVSFYGEKGSMAFGSSGYQRFDLDGELVEEVKPDFDDRHHFENFLNAIRDGEKLNAPIADAQKSAMLCHLGNIAYRQERSLSRESEQSWEQVIGEQGEWWKRHYREGWKV